MQCFEWHLRSPLATQLSFDVAHYKRFQKISGTFARAVLFHFVVFLQRNNEWFIVC